MKQSRTAELIDVQPIDVKTIDDLVGPGAQPGTVPTDLEQSTGVERLEILGKMEGVDIFDMRPLDASRKGTLKEPIMVRSAGEEQYAGCTGYPVDSHGVIWLTVRLISPQCWKMRRADGCSRERTSANAQLPPSRSPATAPLSAAPSVAASTRWSTSAPRTTTDTATATITTAMRSPRTSPTSSSPSTTRRGLAWPVPTWRCHRWSDGQQTTHTISRDAMH